MLLALLPVQRAWAAAPAANTVTEIQLFGPKKYVRTTGPKDVYTATIPVPAWLKSPFRLHVQNGEANGSYRISSATIKINNTAVLSQSDFNQNVATLDRTVTLTATTTLEVTLASKPTSYLTIWIYGAPADLTLPVLAWTAPAPGSTINSATPLLAVTYDDLKAANEPAASGVDTATLQVLIDNVDRTALFTRRSDEASGDIPANAALAPGLHAFKASISDKAGNRKEVTGQFRVDLTPPTIAFTAPAAGAYLATRTPAVTVTYQDDVAVTPATLSVTVNGTALPAGSIAAGPAQATINAGTLDEGPNQITATIRDAGGNTASASVSFNVDVTKPVVAIAQPGAASRIGSRDVAVTLTWSDAQAIVPATGTAKIDGNAVALTATDDGATAQLTALADGSHTFTASVADRAGNIGTAAVTFIIDTTVPVINVVTPPAAAILKVNTPDVEVRYSDNEGVNTGSLKVRINTVDQTALFTKGAAAATGKVTTPLPEGTTTVAAEIRDVTNNLGSTVSTFLVDTIAPTGTIDAPAARVPTAAPLVTVSYADGGSGIDPTSVVLTVDDAIVANVLSAGPDSASGTLVAALADGPHSLLIGFTDRAGNATTLTRSFTVDTVKPQVEVAAPADDTFVNTATPPLRITYSDPNGTGIDTATLRLSLQNGTDPAVNVLSYVSVTAAEATGLVPSASPLTDGSYHLTAVIADKAGNESTFTSRFEVDTAPPTVEVETPAANGYAASSTPRFTVRWSDALSGVDTARVTISVDGVDKTARFTMTPTGATGTLLAADALAEGQHAIRIVLFDRAGNAAPVLDQTFTVDTIVPTVQIDAPANNGYVGPAPYQFAATFADTGGSGVAPTWVVVTIDGIDRTADFTITPTSATATIATALPDGPHTMIVSVLDWAANTASATAAFKADATVPVVAITSPAAGAWLTGATVAVTGTLLETSPVSVEVNGVTTQATNGTFHVTIPTQEGSFVIRATATDAASNRGTAQVTVNVDSVAPVITVSEPAAGLITAQSTFTLTGSIADTSIVTLTLDGQPLALTANAFTTSVPLTAEGVKTVTLTATDQSGNSSTKSVAVTRDTIVPQVNVLSPGANQLVGSMPVIVSGTVQDATAARVTVDGVAATVNGESWQASIDALSEGPHTFAIVATDAAGNSTPVSHVIRVDLLAPVLTITAPLSGTLTKNASVTVTGTAKDTSLVSVAVDGVVATLQPGANPDEQTFTATNVPLPAGDHSVVAIATDGLGRTSNAAILITRDSVPPSVIVNAPQLITRTRPAHVTALVEDNLGVHDVVFKLGETVLVTQTAPPFGTDVIAPSASQPGDTLKLTVTATDTAGNSATVVKDLRVTSDGAVTGQVLSNDTGLPIASARVRIAGQETRNTVTDASGRYALPANDQNLVLIIEEPANAADPLTTAERVVSVQSAVGTVPVDARLTLLGHSRTINTVGGTLTATGITVQVPAGAVTTPTVMHLTPLGVQGLPNLLPLGWSPAAAFDVRVDGTLAANVPFDATITTTSTAALHLAFYDTTAHAWTAIATSLAPSGGAIHLTLPAPGTYALVTPDNNSVPAPVTGSALAGVTAQPIPDTATSSGQVNPPTLPPTGGSAVGTLTVHSPTPLPSGTVIQAEVTETFSLSTGELASEEKRTQDLVLFSDGNDATAQFPIVPSRSFPSGALIEGRVHLDILAGRESVRGRTGGSQAVSLTAGEVTVTVPAGSLPEDLAISATPAVLSTFLPRTDSASPLAEVVLDFGGVALGTSASLSINATGAASGDSVVVARVERVAGVPKVVVVASAELVTDGATGRYVSKDLSPLAGIRRDGRYVFYKLTAPWSLVSGSVGLPALTPYAVVAIGGLPFVAITDDHGDFATIARLGTAQFTATVPGTSLAGTATAQVVAGQVAAANINLTAQPTSATVTPADGATRVATSTQIEIAATAPLRASSANASTIVLSKANGTGVVLRFVFSGSGRTLAIVPQALLDAGETYTLRVNGLADVYGGSVDLAPVTFSTAPEEAPDYDTKKIVFTMPGSNGLVTVSAPAGSLPPGTRIMIVNAGNGIVVSFTAGNDGSFTGTFPATISDRLVVTITDPIGNIVTFTRSQFTATDGSGKTAIGPGGGVVEGPGGVELRIPEGALDQGAVFKIESFGPDAYPERPDIPGAHWGGGLKITSEQKPTLKKEGDLVFPRPADAPEGSFFYIYRRLTGPNGQVAFQTIDHAYDDGHGKVVTASPPFIGWKDSVAAWQTSADVGGIGFGLATQVVFSMMYTWDALFPGLPVQGAVVGHVYRPVWDPGATEPRYEPVARAEVKTVRENGNNVPQTIAISEADGHFALWDSHYTGGTVDVQAKDDHGGIVTGTAYQANVSNTRANAFGNLLNTYGYAADINLTFPATTPPPPSPDVEVRVLTLDQNNGLLRTDINGVVAADTPLLIGFKFKTPNNQITNATINGEELPVRVDDGRIGTGDQMDFIVSSLYTPRNAGTYQIKATALNALGGAPVQAEHTFLAVAAGGTNNAAIPNEAPDWITRQLVPKANALGVAVDVLPQVVFTEPVVNVMAGLEFFGTGNTAFNVSAVGLDSSGRARIIQDLRLEPADTKVTSITIVPIGGMDFGTLYTLRLNNTIHDTDTDSAGNPAPRSFPIRTLTFTTVDPAPLGDSAEEFFAPAVGVIGDHAYVARQTTGNGYLSVYEIGDPEKIREVGRAAVLGMPTHLAVDPESPAADGHPVVAIGSGLKFNPPGPSNVYLYDVSNPAAPKRTAIVSLTESAEEGIVLRLALRKSFLYTITYPHGIQVIDLARATELYADADRNVLLRARMLLDSVVAGRGFGQAAVVNTIRVTDPQTGAGGHLMDLAAGQYVVNGTNKTLVIATGSTPFVVVDPGESTPRIVRAPASDAGNLEFGRAITLARVANRDLAVIVGTGQARDGFGGFTTGTALFVFDMANPLVPNLIGSRIVDPSGSDVEVSGTTAVVATAGGAMTFSLADPATPRYLGTVEGTGYRIALGAEGGYLVSSGTTSQSSAGLHVASFKPVVVIKNADPVMISVDQTGGDVDHPQKVHAVEPLVVNVKVIPPVSGLTGNVVIGNKRFVKPDGSDGGATLSEPYPIVWDHPEKGEGHFTIPAGQQYEDTDLAANATVESDNGTLRSVPRTIRLGWVRLDLDANNNSEIDGLDREAARKGRPFAFWESEPFYELKRLATSGDKPEPGGADKGLADYFTASITVNKLVPEPAEVRLRLSNGGTNADWRVVMKKVDGKAYLKDPGTAAQQVAAIVGADPGSTPVCQATDDRIHNIIGGECRPNSDGYVTLPPLLSGTYELLVRCANCLTRNPQNLDDFPRMWLDYVPSATSGTGTAIDETKVEIRPVRQWITYMSARTVGETMDYKPLAKLEPREKTMPFLDEREKPGLVPEANSLIWGNTMGAWSNSESHVPKDARDVTVIVHGYNVTDADMRAKFLPTLFKRLYWVGHPVLRRQGEWRKKEPDPDSGCVMNCAHTVGISWPSNYQGLEPDEPSWVGSKYYSMAKAIAAYPEDEYRAFASGPAIAKYLAGVKNEKPDRKIRVLAHSLGNLAVNSAISRPELSATGASRVIQTYVMNEAAFAAEAMDDSYLPDATVLWGEPHVALYGRPDDTIWEQDYALMDTLPGGGVLRTMWEGNVQKLRNETFGLSLPDPRDFYIKRWRQTRTDPLPGPDLSVQPNRGPWKGLFQKNKERAHIYNTYSGNDLVLKVVWRVNQLEQKPLSRVGRLVVERLIVPFLWKRLAGEEISDALPVPPWRSADNAILQNWTLLDHKPTDAKWNSVFDGEPGAPYWTTKRQWGELAYWFPATSFAAGSVSLDDKLGTHCIVDQCNTNMTSYSDYEGPWSDGESAIKDLGKASLNLNSHSYLAFDPFTRVYPAYDEIRKMFDPKNESSQ